MQLQLWAVFSRRTDPSLAYVDFYRATRSKQDSCAKGQNGDKENTILGCAALRVRLFQRGAHAQCPMAAASNHMLPILNL